ncbi:alpha/beta hydrolase [Acidicapsa dinghuensis]|uniref:Alpha/beta hydrolase n=2 Tax=Acidicapsa dinghuensis TaxID=2218256 RepID=A0ABW1E901_9BACT
MSYRVFLPQSVADGHNAEPLPVVYLLHGNGGGFRDWSNESDVARYAALGAILVMPEGGASYFLNAVGRPKDRYEDYLTKDLVKDVAERFPARRDRAGRAVIGVSMGGYAALKVGLSHPEEYGFVGAMSPPVDAPERGFSWRRFWQWWNFREILGPMGSEQRRERDVFALVDSVRPEATGFVYLGAGEREPLLDPVRRFAGRLRRRGFAFVFQVKPGGHDWGEWNRQIPDCFERWKTIAVPGGIAASGH